VARAFITGLLKHYLQLQNENGFALPSVGASCTSPRTNLTDSNWKPGSVSIVLVTPGTSLALPKMISKTVMKIPIKMSLI
jgi:hypothetical protein